MDGKNETVLVLDPVELRDFGSYVCHVSDKNSDDEGEDSNTARLDVIPQPGRNGMRPKLLTELDYEMRDDLASLLEIKKPRLRGWRAIGSKYGLTHYKLRLMANSGEPGTNVLEYLATREPELTVYDFCKTLKDSFKRLDIVAKLENHFLVAITDEDGRWIWACSRFWLVSFIVCKRMVQKKSQSCFEEFMVLNAPTPDSVRAESNNSYSDEKKKHRTSWWWWRWW